MKITAMAKKVYIHLAHHYGRLITDILNLNIYLIIKIKVLWNL